MFMEKLSLKGKTAIIAGAGGGGIGTETTLALAEAGASVVVVDIAPERLKETEKRLTAMGARSLSVIADIREKTEVERIVKEAVEEFGAVHCLANVAGGTQEGDWKELLDYTEENFDRTISLNLRYVFLMNQAVARSMVERNIPGSMVSVASVSGITSSPYHAPYGAAKAGLMAMTKTMAVEWGQYGIRVNALAPGGVDTPRVRRLAPDAPAPPSGMIPLVRLCKPEEIASGILFLLSDLASMITGHTLVVDGGATSKFALTVPFQPKSV